MATATSEQGTQDKTGRTVVSVPGELVAQIDAAIRRDGGEALDKLGVSVESMRQGFVHKLIADGLARANGSAGK